MRPCPTCQSEMAVYHQKDRVRLVCLTCASEKQAAYRMRRKMGGPPPKIGRPRTGEGPRDSAIRLESVLPIEEVYRDDLFCDESAEEIRHAARVLRIQDQIEDETCEFRRQELRDEMRRIVREWDDQHREVG